MAKKNKPKSDNPPPASVPDDLQNMDIRVNEMGEIIRGYDIDDINAYLDKNVKDKKLDNEPDGPEK